MLDVSQHGINATPLGDVEELVIQDMVTTVILIWEDATILGIIALLLLMFHVL
jgi:hypothetical protein